MAKTIRQNENIYGALGFSDDQADNLKARAQMMMQLEQWIDREGLTQVKAAERLGITQNRVSDLKRGKIDKFSVDLLMKLLSRAGFSVSLKVFEAA